MAQRDSGGYQSNIAGADYNQNNEDSLQPDSAADGYGTDNVQPSSTAGISSNDGLQSGSKLEQDVDTQNGSRFADTQPSSHSKFEQDVDTQPSSRFGDDDEFEVTGESNLTSAERDGAEPRINFSESDEESPSRQYDEKERAGPSTKERMSRYRRGDATSEDLKYLRGRGRIPPR